MSDNVPTPEERHPLYGALYLALALPGGLVAWVPTQVHAVFRWLSGDLRAPPVADGADPSLLELDPAQVAAVTAALGDAIDGGTRSVPSLLQRRAEEEETGHPNDDGHLLYPLIQSLETGDVRLFVSGSTASVRDLPDADGLYRLSDAHENPLILTASTERFSGPCELADETTRTWVMRLKITTKLVCLSKRQLHEQNQELAEERFAEVAGQSLEQILEVACSFTDATWSDVHISQQLTIFDTLVDVLFNIQDLHFSRCGEVAGKMVNAFGVVIQRTSIDIHSSNESTIHPATFVLIRVLEFFCRNRDMVQPILESGDFNADPCSDMFNCWVSKLNECVETMFQENDEGAETMLQEKGRWYLFVLNNTQYVLEMMSHPGLLRSNVVTVLRSLIEQYIASYLHECWFPPMMSYLDGDSLKKPRHSSLDKFTKEFFRIYKHQGTWRVRTQLKKKLRDEIVNLIVPKYVNYLEALHANPISCWSPWFKGVLPTRSEYTGAELEYDIKELFER